MEKNLVLVVDDEPSIRLTCSAILQMHGFRTASAENGEQALHMAFDLRPDVVLTDVIMPEMNGIQLAIALQEALPGTPVVLFSGNTETADVLAGARAQGYSFKILAKPVGVNELLEAVKAALAAYPDAAAQAS